MDDFGIGNVCVEMVVYTCVMGVGVGVGRNGISTSRLFYFCVGLFSSTVYSSIVPDTVTATRVGTAWTWWGFSSTTSDIEVGSATPPRSLHPLNYFVD